jgi:hypothetical protein
MHTYILRSKYTQSYIPVACIRQLYRDCDSVAVLLEVATYVGDTVIPTVGEVNVRYKPGIG